MRTSLKFIFLIAIALLLVLCAVIFIYRPTYSVTLNGEFIGYSANKSKLQNKINTYMQEGDAQKNVAFVQIDELPEYTLCLLKKGNETNDNEIFEKVKSTGTVYYRYYAITEDSDEKAYVGTYTEVENTIAGLKEKNSTNKEKLGYVEKFSTELQEFSEIDTIISDLYVAPVVKKVVKTYSSTGISSSANTSGNKISLGIALIRPVGGTITSRFGGRRGGMHTGLDIATSRGTPISAVADGTVTYAGSRGSYGNMVIVSHGDGIETYYAHCNSIEVSVGEEVSQGEEIATVGSTGNSTGPHLHLEIRVNGVAQNPQNYLY